MKLSTPRYTFCLFFQIIFMICDLLFNCVSLFPRSRDGLLVLFIFQDLFLVLSITTMLMTFFSTYLFQLDVCSGRPGGGAGAQVPRGGRRVRGLRAGQRGAARRLAAGQVAGARGRLHAAAHMPVHTAEMPVTMVLFLLQESSSSRQRPSFL